MGWTLERSWLHVPTLQIGYIEIPRPTSVFMSAMTGKHDEQNDELEPPNDAPKMMSKVPTLKKTPPFDMRSHN